jgi:hypothetical protein
MGGTGEQKFARQDKNRRAENGGVDHLQKIARDESETRVKISARKRI